MAMFRHWRNPGQQRPRMNSHPSEQLKATLNLIPANTWYATPSGGLTFVNKRNADYGGLPRGYLLQLGDRTRAASGSPTRWLHPHEPHVTRPGPVHTLSTGET